MTDTTTWTHDASDAMPRPQSPANTGYLTVSDGHQLYFEERGRRDGIPLVFLHGGPGSGARPLQTAVFDPSVYWIVNFDQRGCGQSRPLGSLSANTTDRLVDDIDRLRFHLGIHRWVLAGGSWGTTLALAYAARYPDHCLGLLLRGVFLARPIELAWWFDVMRSFYPDAWARFSEFVAATDPKAIMDGYYERLSSGPSAARCAAALEWKNFERGCGSVHPRSANWTTDDPERAIASALIHVHYFRNRFFLPDGVDLRAVPSGLAARCEIVHARQDIVCPVETAFKTHAGLPGSRLQIIEGAGHALEDDGNWQAMMRAADRLKTTLLAASTNAAG